MPSNNSVNLMVIKIGGGVISDPDLLGASVEAIGKLPSLGYVPIIIHGGGPQISESLKAIEGEPQFVDGLRVTSKLSIGTITQSLIEVNNALTTRLRESGTSATGLMDVFEAEYLNRNTYGHVGKVSKVNLPRIQQIIERGEIPVISCIASHVTDGYLNVNGDDAAAALVKALHPLKYISFTSTGGVLDANGDVIKVITPSIFETMIHDGSIDGGMLKKLKEAFGLISEGATESVIIIHPQYLAQELLTKGSYGTTIISEGM